MIEKLDIKNYENKQQLVWFGIINKLNELVDAVNELQHDNSEKANCQGSVLTMVDNQVTANLPNIDLGELAFLSKENSDLKDELERTRKALEIAVDVLKEIDKTRCAVDVNLYAVNHKLLNAGNVFCWTTIDDLHNALEQITALEQKD